MAKVKKFQQIYNRLNPQQREAVDTIEGPVMVVAGPGTGKTQVLAARIANILLKTDVQPYNILALTFTDSAAKNMRDRVVSMIGQPGYYVQISTFHAFCSEVIKSHPESFPIDRDSQPLSDLERYNLVQSIIYDLDLEVLKPINRPLFYIKEVMKAVSDLKREGVGLEKYEELIETDLGEPDEDLTKTELRKFLSTQAKNKELLQIYTEYEARLRDSLRFDFDDMISLVARAFAEDEILLLEYQERLQYILVDEYQDTNSGQNNVVHQLAKYWGEQANIFVVGDPHQSIYRFQGASVENIYQFVDQYPTLKLVTLEKGYRCPQPIYDAAHRLIGHNNLTTLMEKSEVGNNLGKSLSKKLVSASSAKQQPELLKAPSQQVELINLAEEIHKLIEKKVQPEEISILYRTNAEANEIQAVLDRWQIPYEIDGGEDILQTEFISQLIELILAVSQIRAGQPAYNLFEVLCFPWLKLPTEAVYKLTRQAGQDGTDLYEVIKRVAEDATEKKKIDICQNDLDELTLFIKQIEAWGVLDAHVTFQEWLETVIDDIKLLDWIKSQPDNYELLINLNSFFSEIASLASTRRGLKLDQVLELIQVMIEHGLSIRPQDLNIGKGAVQLSTAHKAKGREWSYVFIVNCVDGRWGNRRNRDLLPLPESLLKFTDTAQKEANEDERRLFYVALTRAKSKCYISYAERVEAEGRVKDQVASMFTAEIEDHIKATDISEKLSPNFQEEALEKMLSPKEAGSFQLSESELFQQLVDRYRLSVSGLNTYLKDTDEFVKNYLLRVPQAQPAYLMYGTAVHASLEKLFKLWQEKQEQLPLDKLLAFFQQQLEKQPIAEEEIGRWLDRGNVALEAYYQQQFVPEEVESVFIERFFGSGFAKTVLDDITLSGRIDRVDWLSKKEKTVKVIDYKTGRPRSINEIEGKTASAALSERELSLPEPIRGPYKRQLLFYKLLTELDPSFKPKVTVAEFDFVEPKNNGKFVKREFELLDEDVELLKDLIREVMTEIRQLKFLN